jgi:excisionase family DNA binding protein
MTDIGNEPVEGYRQADQRLRLLLLGDGIDTVGRVTGEEHRRQVTVELRRMRNAVDAILERESGHAVENRSDVRLDDELRNMASSRSLTQHAREASVPTDSVPTFVTPSEAAEALRMSVSTIYRAVRNGEIRAVRLTETRRGALRIPTSELRRLSNRDVVRQS